MDQAQFVEIVSYHRWVRSVHVPSVVSFKPSYSAKLSAGRPHKPNQFYTESSSNADLPVVIRCKLDGHVQRPLQVAFCRVHLQDFE